MRQPDGTDAWTVVEVRAGLVYVHRSVPAFVMMPEELQRLRHIYQEAQAVALYERGAW